MSPEATDNGKRWGRIPDAIERSGLGRSYLNGIVRIAERDLLAFLAVHRMMSVCVLDCHLMSSRQHRSDAQGRFAE
jgi:hypothetical protein